VLVKLHSSSVNPVDTYVRNGAVKVDGSPCVLGGDLAGVVAEADEGSRFKCGDHVAALTPGGWVRGRGAVGDCLQQVQGKNNSCCSSCSSMQPAELMAAASCCRLNCVQ
jgi:NADPH:quinone reductase-like Zn-dependent oxidoreductase